MCIYVQLGISRIKYKYVSLGCKYPNKQKTLLFYIKDYTTIKLTLKDLNKINFTTK